MSLRLVKYFKGPAFEAADWTSQNPTLARGEIGYLLNGGTVIGAKVGEGAWNSLDFFGKKLVSKLHTLNVTGAASSGSGVGFEIEEGGSITGYLKTNSARTGFLFNSPANTFDAEFLLSSLSANRSYVLPNKSGTIALIEDILGVTLNSGQIFVGNASNIATPVTLSGDATLSNTGVLTITSVNLSTQVTGVLPIANGGTGTSTVFTQGRIVYIGAAGAYSTDSGFNWDATNNILLIGESTSSIRLHSGNATGNTFLGYNAGNTTLTGQYNTAIGDSLGTVLTNGENNVLVGSGSGQGTTSGSSNTLLGYRSGYSNITGGNNVAIGGLALYNTTGSSGNIAIGYNAGRYYTGTNNLTAATNSIYLGYEATASANSVGQEVVIGHQAVGNGSNTTTIGGPLNTTTYFVGDINLTTIPDNDNALTQMLVRDGSTGLIKYRDASTFISSLTIATANGFAGTVTVSSTPEITLTTSITGLLKGNGTAISAAVANTDYQSPITLTVTGNSGASTFDGSTLNIPTYSLSGLGGQPSSNNLTSLSGLTYVSNSFVKMTASGTFTLDTNSYYLASNPSGYTSNTGTVTTVSVISQNGFAGSVDNGSTQPAITLSTTVTGLIKGNGTAILAAIAGTDYQAPLTDPVTGTGTNNYIPKFTVTGSTIGNSIFIEDGGNALKITAADAGIRLDGSRDYLLQTVNSDGRFRILDETGASERLSISTTGQLKLNNYVSSTSFPGTPQGYLAFDNQGNLITTAVSGGSGSKHVIYTGASGTPLVERANLRFTNGLSAADSSPDTLAKLGGALIENTTVSGEFSLNLNTQNISIFSGSPNYNSGTNVVFVGKSTTRPSAPPVDGVYIWAEKNSEPFDLGTTRLMVMDSAGNIKAL